MKIIAIGDTHGRKNWEQIVKNPADRYVFIGDYFDTHGTETAHQQMENFKKILDFRKEHGSQVVLLIGNHDFHYLKAAGLDRYSGFQDHHQEMIRELLQGAIDDGHIRVCLLHDGVLYSHAGVTTTWLYGHIESDIVDVDDYINDLLEEKPEALRFAKEGKSPYGDDPCQGPLWVRPDSLEKDAITGVKQVVGHTVQEKITSRGDTLFFIDTIGTSGEYLEVTDGNPCIKQS